VFFCEHRIGVVDLRRRKEACGLVDIAAAMPTTPQAKQQRIKNGFRRSIE
jgi:hypothetical protein